jgi:hypothetical protein
MHIQPRFTIGFSHTKLLAKWVMGPLAALTRNAPPDS